MTGSTLDSTALDRAVTELRLHADLWSTTPLAARIGFLERLLPRIGATAPELVAASARAKGYDPGSLWAAEDWAGGPWALAQNVRALLHVLRRIAEGKLPVEAGAVREEAGRTWVDVFPAGPMDRLLLSGYSARVRMLPDVTPQQVLDRAAARYRGAPAPAGVALVLGAGNVAAITALDILDKLYAHGQVVVAKMNPVNAHLRPHVEDIFAEFVRSGFVRFVEGAAAEGAHLAGHPDVDAIHVTGSERTHDAIVWGTDDLAEQRRRDDTPILDKPFTSELGGVSPCIVVPGPWSDADVRYQAEHIVTSKLNNSGHNCIATQVLILPADWPGTERLLDEIRALFRTLPPRADYYPGAAERLDAVRAGHPSAEQLGTDNRILVADLADPDGPLIADEVFATALGVVRLPGSTAEQFLPQAVDYANRHLPGTLGATVIVHPRTEHTEPAAVREALDALRYGTIGVNCWSAVSFLLGYTPWGAHPGHTRHTIGSGTGFVHNAHMLVDVEKTVVRAPFAPAPRGLLTGSPSLSPRPPYFVTNRTGLTTLERLTRYTVRPRPTDLPALLASALRG